MELSRRNFLKGTGALAGISAMGAIGLGCSPAANQGTETKGDKAEAPKTPAETTPTALKEAT
ncbi:MAG: twin-arginine translocation signal domain-containing protein, partial [Slackia isoflavoniconvertens]|nr:twin-arginine translocation signal domain-containing protein [Slackia isoflavoniconvertens]